MDKKSWMDMKYIEMKGFNAIDNHDHIFNL